MSPLLTAKDVAEQLQVAVSTVYLWAEQGRLPHICLAQGARRRCIRFRQRVVEEWLRDLESAGRVDPVPNREQTVDVRVRQRGKPPRR